MSITAGIDIGTGVVKTVLFEVDGEHNKWLAKRVDRIRNRDPYELAERAYRELCEEAGIDSGQVDYIATTGEGENLKIHTGHFYTMTTHARGAIYFNPETRALLDIGALHGRAIRVDERGKVISYRMTSQCASGSGQFLENIARYLGVAQDEIGPLSLQADDPESVSSICAVLAETDVINMVSRGISGPNILRGIHDSMAGRLSKLLRTIGTREGVVMLTGGLAMDEGLLESLKQSAKKDKLKVEVYNHPDSIYAGAIGAALWGGFRHEKLAREGQQAMAS